MPFPNFDKGPKKGYSSESSSEDDITLILSLLLELLYAVTSFQTYGWSDEDTWSRWSVARQKNKSTLKRSFPRECTCFLVCSLRAWIFWRVWWRTCWNRDAIMAIKTSYMGCQTTKRLTPKHIGEERAGWFTLIVLMMYCDCKCYVISVFLAVPLFDMQCVIVIFPYHTQLLLLLLVKLYTRQTDWKTWCNCSMQTVTLL